MTSKYALPFASPRAYGRTSIFFAINGFSAKFLFALSIACDDGSKAMTFFTAGSLAEKREGVGTIIPISMTIDSFWVGEPYSLFANTFLELNVTSSPSDQKFMCAV